MEEYQCIYITTIIIIMIHMYIYMYKPEYLPIFMLDIYVIYIHIYIYRYMYKLSMQAPGASGLRNFGTFGPAPGRHFDLFSCSRTTFRPVQPLPDPDFGTTVRL